MYALMSQTKSCYVFSRSPCEERMSSWW